MSEVPVPKVPVLVTGGAGYIGSHAMLALKDAGWSVSVIDDLSNGVRQAVPDDVPFYEGNIADRVLLERIFAEQGTQAIMHFAGSIVVPESVEKPLRYYGNNTVATHALIGAALDAGIQHILFSSTAAVYGAPERVPVAEDDPKEPINPYGSSKLMTEWMLRDASAAYPFNYGALRYFNVAGADPQRRTGQQGRGSTHLIKVAVETAVGLRDHVAVYGTDYLTPDGTCIRDYIHVSDLAAAHVAALEWLIAHPQENLVVNCGYGRGLSVLEVLDAVDRANGAPIARVMEGRRAGDPPKLVSANRRILETLDWRPQFEDIDRIVGDALAWERTLLERRSKAA
jgi:UDP-glucose 4-epimerase